jgi:hypothetical protein
MTADVERLVVYGDLTRQRELKERALEKVGSTAFVVSNLAA